MTAPPLGFGFTLLVFDPGGMRFEDYFGFHKGMSERERVIALIAGIAPTPFPMRYLSLDDIGMKQGRLPSVGAAPLMIAGVIATEVVNLITGKTPPLAVPTVIQYDALLRKFRRRTYPMGMRGPIQALKKSILRKNCRFTRLPELIQGFMLSVFCSGNPCPELLHHQGPHMRQIQATSWCAARRFMLYFSSLQQKPMQITVQGLICWVLEQRPA